MFKKVLIVFFVALVFMLFPTYIKADCDTCNPKNCDECGCVLKDGKCVYSNIETEEYLSCGNGYISKIPPILPKTTKIIYYAIQVAVPVLLVVFGSIDLIKGVIAAKEDEIKKGQQTFIKRLIAGVLVFFVFVIVKFAISLVADKTGVINCTKCFITGDCTI